jgi:hypothetical protein
MKLNEAIEILEKFNAYRRYRGDDIPAVPASATDIGIALDVAIAALKTQKEKQWGVDIIQIDERFTYNGKICVFNGWEFGQNPIATDCETGEIIFLPA